MIQILLYLGGLPTKYKLILILSIQEPYYRRPKSSLRPYKNRCQLLRLGRSYLLVLFNMIELTRLQKTDKLSPSMQKQVPTPKIRLIFGRPYFFYSETWQYILKQLVVLNERFCFSFSSSIVLKTTEPWVYYQQGVL